MGVWAGSGGWGTGTLGQGDGGTNESTISTNISISISTRTRTSTSINISTSTSEWRTVAWLKGMRGVMRRRTVARVALRRRCEEGKGKAGQGGRGGPPGR